MDGKQQCKIRPQDQAATLNLESLRVTVPEIWPGQNRGKKKKNNKANWMVSNSAKLDRRTKQHTQFGVSGVTVPEIWPGQNLGRKKNK